LLPTKYNGRRPIRSCLLLGVALAAAKATMAGPVQAQWALGPWEDATVVPRGVLRLGVPLAWTRANERFGRQRAGVESLGSDLTRDSLGASIFDLSGLGTPLQLLTGLMNPPLSLGRLRVGIEATSWSVPIALDYGLTSRVSIGVVVPYVKTRAEVFPRVNPLGPEGTLGLNPAFTVPGARTRNSQVVTELLIAAGALRNAVNSCVGSSAPSCMAINANPAGATALVTAAMEAANAVASVYGTNAAPGSPFAPVGHAPLQTAVDGRLAALDVQFTGFLGPPPAGSWLETRPVGAPPLASDDFQRLLTDPALGIESAPLADIERGHVGDIELGVKAVLATLGGAPAAGREAPGGLGARIAIAGILRLGTGQLDTPNDFADIATGDDQSDLEVRGYMDLLAARRWWASLVIRYGMQRPDRVALRVPAYVGEPFPPAGATHLLDRDLGDFVEVEVAPRFTPNSSFAVSANYRLRTKQADRYSATAPGDVTGARSPDLLAQGTAQREQRIGLGLTFSTLRGYADRRAPWPLEASFHHTQVLNGRGGMPKTFFTAVTLRLYRPLTANPMRRPGR
jgi:hypothetical protein